MELLLVFGVILFLAITYHNTYANAFKQNAARDLRELEEFKRKELLEAQAKKAAEIIRAEMAKEKKEAAEFKAAVHAAVNEEFARAASAGTNQSTSRNRPYTAQAQHKSAPIHTWSAHKQAHGTSSVDETPSASQEDMPHPATYQRDQEFPDLRQM